MQDGYANIRFSAVIRPPVAACETAYSSMDRPFLPEHAEAIRQYVAARPKDRHGKHRYSAQQWGLDPGELRATTRRYTDHYEIELEG